MIFRTLLTIGILFTFIFPAYAQDFRLPYGVRPKKAFSQQALEKFEGAGTIEAIQPGKILMVTASHENCLIWLQPQTKVTTIGEAKQEFLYPGLFVQLKAQLDKHRTVTDAIEELTVITPSPEKQPGIYPLGENQAADRSGKMSAPGPCIVIGRITALHSNKLQVNVGHGTLLGQLSDNAKIRLDIADYSMARKGDKITVTGLRLRNVPGQVQAVEVKIELAETLAGMTEKSLPVRAQSQYRSKSTPKPKQPAGLPSPPLNR